jgi:hypothetical protein
MKLETFLLLAMEGRLFIPSYATLARIDPLETGLLFNFADQRSFWASIPDDITSDVSRVLFNCHRRDNPNSHQRIKFWVGQPPDEVEDLREDFRLYIDELAYERCIWCWNEFTSFSYALWQLYGSRGVAIISTVGKVRDALLSAGVKRGIVAPIEYMDDSGHNNLQMLAQSKDIFRPHLIKSIVFDYEKEVRFVFSARRDVLRDKGGLMLRFADTEFFTQQISPYLQREEVSAIDTMIGKLTAPGIRTTSTDYKAYDGNPFTDNDSPWPSGFLDM